MCVVDVRVDEKLLREVMPELDTNAAIREWAQRLIDLRIREVRERREERLSSLRLSRVTSELDESQIAAEDETTMSIEEARKMTLQAVREEYAKA